MIAVFHNLFNSVFIDETKVEIVTVCNDFNAIEGRDDVGQAADALVTNQTVRATTVCVTVAGAITFFVKFNSAVAAERQNLSHNGAVLGTFSDHKQIGSTHWNEL